MKQFTLAAALLAAIGLTVGCGGAPDAAPAADSPAPTVDAPAEGDADADADAAEGEGEAAPAE